MANSEQDKKPGKLKKFWDASNKFFQFISLMLGIITSAIALWGKLGDAKKEIDATNKQITEVSADMKEVKTQMETIKEYLLARGIIPPGH